MNGYFWDTTAATPGWVGGPLFQGVAATYGTSSYKLIRVGPEEASVLLVGSNGATTEEALIRLGRGRYDIRVDYRSPMRVTNEYYRFRANYFTDPKVAYNSAKLVDRALDVAPTCPTDYGYGAYIFPSSFGAGSHAIHVMFAQYQTADKLPQFGGGYMNPGDTLTQAINAWRSYGFAMVPYGTNAVYSTANLMQEMESATLSGGFVSAADAGSSGGSAAKLPSGTAVGAIALGPGAAYDGLASGTYDLWVRLRVTSNAAGTTQLRLGWWDGTSGVFVVSSDWSPSNFTTVYAWYRVSTAFALTGNGHSQEFRAISITNAATTDFWIDEMAIVPKTLVGSRGPQDVWQNFMYDRSVRMIRG